MVPKPRARSWCPIWSLPEPDRLVEATVAHIFIPGLEDVHLQSRAASRYHALATRCHQASGADATSLIGKVSALTLGPAF